MVIIAFATIYLVWGSTYLFIAIALKGFPPMILGALRFLTAGVVLLGWFMLRGERPGKWRQIRPDIVTGLMLLFIGNGAVIWAEKWLPSSLVAVLISSAPFWFIIFDRPKWKENLTSPAIILGLVLGFIGVTMMFGEKVWEAIFTSHHQNEIIGLGILLIGIMSWSGGSLYSKHHSPGSSAISSAMQMLAAGVTFFVASFFSGDWSGFEWSSVTAGSWFSLMYLVVFGSIAAYSAYVWLLKVRSAASVSTYAYVNPVIAVLLGVFFAGEYMSLLQVAGLVVILVSVLLINLTRYRKNK
jgi:drug/metabolite transporter (DMT)-like permease